MVPSNLWCEEIACSRSCQQGKTEFFLRQINGGEIKIMQLFNFFSTHDYIHDRVIDS